VTPDSPNSATVEIVSENGSEERRRIPGIFHAFASRCVKLIASERLAHRTVIGIECNDVLFIGEVVGCAPGDGDQWEIDVKIAQTLTGLESLMILRAQLEQHQSLGKDAI
jgi:hypothetical protein